MKPDLHMPEGSLQPLTAKVLPGIPLFFKLFKTAFIGTGYLSIYPSLS